MDHTLVRQLTTLAFTKTAQNVGFIGGPGIGKAHLAIAIAVMGKRVRLYSTVDLVHAPERKSGKARPAGSRRR